MAALTPERVAEISREQRELNEAAVLKHAQEARMTVPLNRRPREIYLDRHPPSDSVTVDGSRNYLPLHPIPLLRPVEPASEYPIAALGPVLGPAAQALVELVQVPAALAGNSVLAAAALAAQSHSNVQTLASVARPLSLYALTIAGSGDRKSATDEWALLPVRERMAALHLEYTRALPEYGAQAEATRLRRKQAREIDAKPEALATRLLDIHEPVAPRKPWILCSEPTAEGLMLSLRDGQYSQGLFSDEGGGFVGSYAMSEDSELRTIAMLSKAWDGSPLDRVRAKDAQHDMLFGRRLSLHLMAQPAVADRLLGNPLYRQQGFLARLLLAAPESLAGTRLHDGQAVEIREDGRLCKYWSAMAALLNDSGPEHPTLGGLELPCLALTPEARALLVSAFNEIEQAQAPDGELSTVREFASKAAEHACRIAGVLTLLADPGAVAVCVEDMSRALDLVQFHLREYIRLIGSATVSDDIRRAKTLLDWIDGKRLVRITARDVMRLGPSCIREAPVAKRCLWTLAEHHWLIPQDDGFILSASAQLALHEARACSR